MNPPDPAAWPFLGKSQRPQPACHEHVAIVRPALADLILSGRKTIESRITKVRGPAFQRVHPGDAIYFRESGGGFRVLATVEKAVHLRDLTAAGLRALREVFGVEIGADAAYWRSRKGSRYASLMWLVDARANLEGPANWRWPGFRDRSAWGSREISKGMPLRVEGPVEHPIARRRRA